MDNTLGEWVTVRMPRREANLHSAILEGMALTDAVNETEGKAKPLGSNVRVVLRTLAATLRAAR